MEFTIRKTNGGCVAEFKGPLNFSVNKEFEGLLERLKTGGSGKVVFDLSQVTQIDSVGLGLLYIAHEDLTAAGFGLSLSAPSPCVKRLLELTESEQTFDIAR